MSRTTSGSAGSTDLRLNAYQRGRLKAVVFDANAYGKARPDFEHLARVARRLADIGIETWVPQPVAWEWAEHVASDWGTTKNAAREQRRNLVRAGLTVPDPIYQSREAVIDAVLGNLDAIPHVRIIELTGASAMEALKDQILQRRPAKVKNDVKTGASDSAWLRDMLTLRSSDEVLIISADSDVKSAFDAWDKPAPLIRNRETLHQTVFDVTVDDGHARTSIVRYLLDRLPVENLDGTGFDIGRTQGLDTAIMREAADNGVDLRVYGASVTRLVALAGLHSATIEHGVPEEPQTEVESVDARPGELGPAKHDVAYATVFFLAEGEATVQTMYNGEDPEVSVLEYDNILIRTQLSFHFTDAAITKVAAETDADAMLVERAYNGEDDAMNALIEALSCVPGIDLDLDSLGNGGDLNGTIEGTSAILDVDMTSDGIDWQISLTLWQGDLLGEIEVTCTYNPDSWWGGSRDGMQGPNGYPVSVNATDLPGNHRLWSVPAWVISRIDWSAFASDQESESDS